MTIALASFAILLTGCGDGPLAPFQPEVTNATDSFQGQATGVTGVSGTVSYTWVNTGTRATINHSTSTTAGSTMLTIRDAANTVVYSRALSPSLNEPTVVGVSGNWTIQLTTDKYAGTMNFRVQKL
jgi:hypothetical protein